MKSRLITGIGVTMVMLLAISISARVHLPPRTNKAADDITYEFGSTGNVLVWQFQAHESNDAPTTYTVKIDNVDLVGHIDAPWQDNVDIIVNVDGLAVGEHTALITVSDTGTDAGLTDGILGTDIAIVTVTEVGGATTTEESTTTEEPTSQETTTTTTEETTTEDTSSEPTSDDDTPLNWNFVLIGFMGLMMYKRRIK